MKIHVTMNTPDCIYYATKDLSDHKKEEVEQLCTQWFQYGEYVTLEIDTEKGTCEVCCRHNQ